jgi:hypothetical protein
MITTGETDHLTAVLISQSDKDCIALLKQGLNSFEDFKQRVLSIINKRADEITGTLGSLSSAKLLSLGKSVEIAKREGTVFANRLVETHADSRVNIKTLNFSAEKTQSFQQPLKFSECEVELQDLLNFSVTYPSEPPSRSRGLLMSTLSGSLS